MDAKQQYQPSRRVNGETMKNYVGSKVRVLGKVVAKEPANNIVRIEGCDKTPVVVRSSTVNQFPEAGSFVEIVGTVGDDFSVMQTGEPIRISDTFDLSNYNKAILLFENKFKALVV